MPSCLTCVEGDEYPLVAFVTLFVLCCGALGNITIYFIPSGTWPDGTSDNQDLSSPDCEAVVWRVDVKPPSRSALRLWNVSRCWRGSEPPPSRRGVPDGAGLSYSSPIGCQSLTLPPRSESAVA